MAKPATARAPDPAAIGEMQEHAAAAAQLLKTLGNEQRLLILCHLLGGELAVGELHGRLQLSQSALSQHLGVLREFGLVETRRESQSIFYSLPRGPVTRVMALLQQIYCANDAPAAHRAPRRTRSPR